MSPEPSSNDGRCVVASVEIFNADDVAVLIEEIEPVMCHHHGLQKTIRFKVLGGANVRPYWLTIPYDL
jgi:hypothetical protein